MIKTALVVLLCAAAAACSATQTASFAVRAPVEIQKACADFNAVRQNPLVRVAEIAGGAAGGPAVSAIVSLASYGGAFCANGAPVGDMTTVARQVGWLENIVSGISSRVSAGVKLAN